MILLFRIYLDMNELPVRVVLLFLNYFMSRTLKTRIALQIPNMLPGVWYNQLWLTFGSDFISNILQGAVSGITRVLNVGLSGASWLFNHKFEQIDDRAAFVDMIHKTIISSPAGSWNHGKIVAVGGKTMMTGGMNPWSEYTSLKQPIIDLAIKITGDATISAHTYADYFWG
jgi:hypothetical protein